MVYKKMVKKELFRKNQGASKEFELDDLLEHPEIEEKLPAYSDKR